MLNPETRNADTPAPKGCPTGPSEKSVPVSSSAALPQAHEVVQTHTPVWTEGSAPQSTQRHRR